MTAYQTTPLLSGSFRVPSGATIGGTVDYPSGAGYVAWNLAAGTYADLVAVAAGIDTAITAAVGGSWTVSLVDSGASGILIDGPGNFNLTVHASLQAFTGLAAAYTALRATPDEAASTAAPSYLFKPSVPIDSPDCWYEHVRAETVHDDGTSVVASIGTITHYIGRVIAHDAKEWRTFVSVAERGTPFRIYHNYPSDTTAWTESNRDGYVDLVIASSRAQETWLTDPAYVILDGTLDCIVV